MTEEVSKVGSKRDEILEFVRGLVRPVLAFACIGLLVAFSIKGMPLPDFVKGVLATIIGAHWGSRTVEKFTKK